MPIINWNCMIEALPVGRRCKNCRFRLLLSNKSRVYVGGSQKRQRSEGVHSNNSQHLCMADTIASSGCLLFIVLFVRHWQLVNSNAHIISNYNHYKVINTVWRVWKKVFDQNVPTNHWNDFQVLASENLAESRDNQKDPWWKELFILRMQCRPIGLT